MQLEPGSADRALKVNIVCPVETVSVECAPYNMGASIHCEN